MENLNLVHLNGLRALEAVGRLGSLQAAAEEFGVSIGAISQQVARAEAQLGRPLFLRTPKGMLPTEAGRTVLARLSDGFRLLSQGVALARSRDDTLLTISVAPVFAARWLVHRLDRFAALYPEIRLRIDATTRLADLDTDGIDLAIRVGTGDWPDVNAELLLEQEVFPVCAPALAERLRQPADLLQLPAVIDGHAMFSWDIWFRKVGLEGRSMQTGPVFNDASLCLDATIAGHGVMLAWQTLSAFSLQQGRLVEPFGIRAQTGFGHYFVTPKMPRLPEKTQRFRKWMREELATDTARVAACTTGGKPER